VNVSTLRPWWIGAAATGWAAFLLAGRTPSGGEGSAAAQLDLSATWEAARTGSPDVAPSLVLDLVEPEDGEGGSEAELAAWVRELGPGAGAAGFYAEGEHLVRVTGSREELERVAQRAAASPLVEGFEPEVLVKLPASAGGEAAAIEPQRPGKERFVPDDPMFGLQWHMEQIHAPEAWTVTRGGGAVVAVIDTGVAWKDDHGVRAVPDLAGTRFTPGTTFVDGATPDGLDDHAHGTHVAGTIAQTTHNGVGVTGVAHEATLMPLKVLSARGSGSVPGIANAIRFAADHGATVINMSLGGPLPSRVLCKAIEYAHAKGVTVVAASGNEHRSKVGYPAACDHTIAVGAVDLGRELTFYSNWGKAQDVTAPGGDTRADRNGDGHPDGVLQNTIRVQQPRENDYLWFQGTSMASPHAAGVAALVVSRGVTNPDEVERILKDTAVHPHQQDWDIRFGAGIIDAEAAVSAAARDYVPERGGFAALGLLGLASGVGAVVRSGRVAGLMGLGSGLALFGGLLVSPATLFGAAAGGSLLATLLGFSAALPLLLSVLLLRVPAARGLLLGAATGTAAFLAHGAVVLPTLLTALPGGPGLDRLWLALQAALAAALAVRISRAR
jgi:serine protease